VIHIFFVPGMFGSTVEYVIRNHTQEYLPVNGNILPDGSMHSYDKQAHLLSRECIENFFKNSRHIKNIVTTTIYPFEDIDFSEIVENFKPYIDSADNCILIHADNLLSAELNLLFYYHKIVNRKKTPNGLDLFFHNTQHNIVNWNATYQTWRDMQPWELRELISFFYLGWTSKWIDSQYQVDSKFLKIKNTDLLYHTESAINQILQFSGLKQTKSLTEFVLEWQLAQQYIVNEFDLLQQIVEYSVGNLHLEWKSINIVAEAIVQQRLRALGYEIRCDGLNTFPTDSKTLYNLLEKV